MFRVVVYAEGPGELAGRDTSRQRAPGTPLTEEELGAAHLLVRRCLVAPAEIRRQLVRECDLDTLARVCPAFAEFLRRLGPARA